MINPDLISKVLKEIKQGGWAAYVYFFDNINSPDWIEPLQEVGYFKNPPKKVMDGDGFYYPIWPESRYLLRVATLVPDKVHQIIMSLVKTESPRLQEDITQIATVLPPNYANKYVTYVKKYLDNQYAILEYPYAVDFCLHLLDIDLQDDAFKLARTLLWVGPDPQLQGMTDEERRYHFSEVQLKSRDHDYEEALSKLMPVLCNADIGQAIQLLSVLLEKTISYKLASYKLEEITDDENAVDDYSIIWRPDINGMNRVSADQPRTGLVSALRDALLLLLNSKKSDAFKVEVLNDVSSLRYMVFRRIVEFVLRDFKNKNVYKALYGRLVRELGPILNQEDLRRAAVIPARSRSPYSVERLRELPQKELIAILCSPNLADRSLESHDLLNAFITLFQSDLGKYLTIIEKFDMPDVSVMHSLFSAASRAGDQISQGQAVKLLALYGNYQKNNLPSERDDYSNGIKISLAHLIEKWLWRKNSKGGEFIKEKDGQKILQILLSLARDEEPTPEHEERYGGDNMDPLTLSINTVRGIALHGLTDFIAWSLRNNQSQNLISIYKELDWHLDKKNDPSQAIRSVYGERLALLIEGNKEWAEKNKDRIFSKDSLGRAASDSYFWQNPCRLYLIDYLAPVLKYNIENLNSRSDKGSGLQEIDYFIHHLMLYYLAGKLTYSDGSLIDDFFKQASTEQKKVAISFIGHYMKNHADSLKNAEKKRIKELWRARYKKIKQQNCDADEFENFGWWVVSDVLDYKWAMDALVKTIDLVGSVEPDFMVLKWIDKHKESDPKSVLYVLEQMINRSRDRWSADTWRPEAKNILLYCQTCGVPNLEAKAVKLQNDLVQRGHFKYHKLDDGK